MSWAVAVIMLISGVFLPTLDVYSDLYFTSWLFHGNYYNLHYNMTTERYEQCETMVTPHNRFGAAMLTPFILSWILVARQWHKNECGMIKKLKTLPFMVLQVYPQYRALRVLFYAKWKRQNGWQKMKHEWESGITHIGKLLEYQQRG